MVLTDKNIEKFQILYKEKFGVEISKDEAQEKGRQLLQLMSFVYKPVTKKNYEKYTKKV